MMFENLRQLIIETLFPGYEEATGGSKLNLASYVDEHIFDEDKDAVYLTTAKNDYAVIFVTRDIDNSSLPITNLTSVDDPFRSHILALRDLGKEVTSYCAFKRETINGSEKTYIVNKFGWTNTERKDQLIVCSLALYYLNKIYEKKSSSCIKLYDFSNSLLYESYYADSSFEDYRVYTKIDYEIDVSSDSFVKNIGKARTGTDVYSKTAVYLDQLVENEKSIDVDLSSSIVDFISQIEYTSSGGVKSPDYIISTVETLLQDQPKPF